jgi:hypothetical protein
MILDENLEKKNEFVYKNIIKNVLEYSDSSRYFDCRNSRIRTELNKTSITLDSKQINEIIQELNRINISFKKIPLKFQLFKINIILGNERLSECYNINFYKNKEQYEKLWNLFYSNQ